MSKKHPHGYLPKIQYHSLQVLEKTTNLLNPDIPDIVKESELASLNKSLDSIIHFTFKLREQYRMPIENFVHRGE
jgi:hypothetical protein